MRRVLREHLHIKGRSLKHVDGQMNKNVDGRVVCMLSDRRWALCRPAGVTCSCEKACKRGTALENDLQGHSRSLTLVPFDRPHMISY